MTNSLHIKKIKVLENQTLQTIDKVKFSLKKWISQAFRDEYTGKWAFRDSELGGVTFGINKGLYLTYKPLELFKNEEFYMLELARTTLNRDLILSKEPDFKTNKRVKVEFDKIFKFKELGK